MGDTCVHEDKGRRGKRAMCMKKKNVGVSVSHNQDKRGKIQQNWNALRQEHIH